MKRNLILSIFVTVTLASCNEVDIVPICNQDTKLEIKELAYDIIKNGYLTFNENQYNLAITKSEAINLGFSAEAYDYLYDSAIKINESIREEIFNLENFTVFKNKANSLDVINQVNDMIRQNHISLNGNNQYIFNITLSESIELGYSEEDYETALQRINDGSIYKFDFIVHPTSRIVTFSNDLMTKSTYLQEIGGDIIQTSEAYMTITQYYSLPQNTSVMNALCVRFESYGSSGGHYFMTITDGGTCELTNAIPGRYYFVPVIMYGDYVGVRYCTASSDGGVCIFYRTYESGLSI